MNIDAALDDDARDLLTEFVAAGVDFIVVGAHALAAHGVTVEDFGTPGAVYPMGLPPRRIDVQTSISGVEFDEAWRGRVFRTVGGLELSFLGRAELVANKRATGRAKDLLDLELLAERAGDGESC